MRLHLAFGAAVAAASLASPASAALLERQGGYYYDTVLDITWSPDTNFAKTAGYSDTGMVNQQTANFLTGRYYYVNPETNILYNDWRLPTLGPDVDDFNPFLPGSNGRLPNGQGATGVGWGAPGDSGLYSELAWMYYANLGGLPRCEAVGDEPCEFNPNYGLPHLTGPYDKGPFTDLQLDFYWTDHRAVNANVYWAFTFADGNQNPRAPQNGTEGVAYVWMVHDGDIAAALSAVPAPEPSTWALLIAGFGLAGVALRRRPAVTA
jgi:hypothetical protein